MSNAVTGRTPANRATTSSIPKLVSARVIAQAANIGARSIPSLIKEGLPVIVLSPNRKRFDVADCVAWLKQKYGTGGGSQ